MSFWATVEKTENLGSFESAGGSFEPIPEKTQVLAAPEEAKWDEYEGNRYISIKWQVLGPKQYANRKIFQKLHVEDAKKKDKALRMLAAIDANAGGKLMASGKEPTDDMLNKALCNKPMHLLLMVWEMNDKKGNWVSAVSPRGNAQPAAEAHKPTVKAEESQADDFSDEDIPF